jgi:hypothetical protein
MSEMSRRYIGPSVPPRLASAVEQIRAMAAHPGVVLQITWVEELPAPQSRAATSGG